jgi:hypothetical protein
MDYSPLEIDKFIEYDVIEITIDKQIELNDTVTYILKEFIESKYTDDEGNTNYRIERYKRPTINDNWEVLNIWYVSVSENSIFKNEDNFRFKKLIFPIKIGNTWNGNSENTLNYQEYKITNTDVAETIENISYSNVLTVLQQNNENLIEKQYSTEKYAKTIGLIYKEIINISELEPIAELPWQQRINIGYIYKQTAR